VPATDGGRTRPVSSLITHVPRNKTRFCPSLDVYANAVLKIRSKPVRKVVRASLRYPPQPLPMHRLGHRVRSSQARLPRRIQRQSRVRRLASACNRPRCHRYSRACSRRPNHHQARQYSQQYRPRHIHLRSRRCFPVHCRRISRQCCRRNNHRRSRPCNPLCSRQVSLPTSRQCDLLANRPRCHRYSRA
jgi:hypothetical protein